ncbi:uncharacterized protein N7484_001376 [Penicillium longicatenatum]|uniref:uncharacterized protein n=1 Tax=Penicillium longicatenatum TaxID=1561947 RepID=UPI0025483FC8|nr:uncharacterized protein N7484_001376 [Penicillium longicatenatum]KAJ5657727.1 hypothetical protein N7484_001376 [Penicillium longicatenatum]
MAPRKRKSDVVGLTDNNEARAAKVNRPTPYLDPQDISNGERFGESTDFIPLTQVPGADEDDAQATELVEGSQDVDESSPSSSMLYGNLETKIVGVRFYNGIATPGEHVILKREPHNQYDPNAIRVDNIMGIQVGHIGRGIAAKLAPYIDSKDLHVEGVLTGTKGPYDCPVTLPLYGPTDPARKIIVKQKMQKDRLPLREFMDAERKEKQRQKQIAAEQKQAEKNARAMALKKAAAGWQAGDDDTMFANLSTPTGLGEVTETIEDLINQSSTFNPREIGQVVESFGQKESDMAKMPMVDTPAGLSTELLPYQKQGLAWMIARESPTLPLPGSDAVVQLWKRSGNNFTNVATNYSSATAPTLSSGGILADDMGLGKTIQVISLILADPAPKTSDSSKATLILAPVGVMSNWRNQIQDHCRAETMPRVLIYHGSGKKEAGNLSQYDVVISSYGALVTEFKQAPQKRSAKGIFSLQWRRVVLDEGHTIRNPGSQGSLAACALRADSRWTLTGTPIINTLKDLYSQVRFLKLSGGLEDMGVFNSVLIRPLTSGVPEARLLLEALMGTICLRRRKDMEFINIRLPKLTSRVLRIKFQRHELEKYSAFQSEAKGALLEFKDKQGTYSHLLEVILRLRQVCNHWALCKNRISKLLETLGQQKAVELTPENMKALQDMLQLQIESQEVCAICLDNFDQPVITACAHSYCKGCIEEVIERQHKCPLCRADIKDNQSLVAPAQDFGEDSDTVSADPSNPSSKIEALVKVLTAPGQGPGTKTVVFSQWTSFLDLVEPHLIQRGINFVRVDGKMSAIRRDNSINCFSTEPTCTVLLASLSVCSVGLNLVAANQAILADSWWAPAIEDQALDRVYRLGQKRETTVWRLIMEDSIEERVLNIQGRKRELMLAAFRETGKKKAEDRATRVADLENLLN